MSSQSKHRISARVTEYKIPPVHDALVMGKDSPVGSVAMKRALSLLIAQPYEHISLKDEVISDVLIRKAILRRLDEEMIINFILTHIKPLMDENEIIHLNLETETKIEVNEL